MNNTIRNHYDLVVVGGGLTGLCAAIAAARNGAKVALVHDRPVLGGNASSEIRMHICGATANMKKPDLSEGGIVHELMLANKRVNHSFNFSIWDAVLFDAAKREENLTLYLNTTMFGAVCDDNMVKRIECYQMTTERRLILSARFFADCTGNGTLCAFAGAEFRTGSEGQSEFGEIHAPEIPNKERMGNTVLFKAIDRGHPVPFVPPVEVMDFTEEQLKYRKHCATIPKELMDKASPDEMQMLFDGFCPDYGYWWIEIPGERENIIEEYEDIRDQLVSAVYGVWNHIKNGGDHGAENYELIWVGMLPGTRESRRVECDYMLNETDVLESRRFEDKVAYGGWHIDNHCGLFEFDRVPSFTYDVPGSYDIPYRSYCVKGKNNLYVGGRCMGASKLAMASSRVMGTCAIGGQAIGTAAALLCETDSGNIRDIDICKLQQRLLKDDCYLPELVNEDKKDIARTATVTASSEADGFLAKYVIDGTARRVASEEHQWRSKQDNELPEWIRLDLEHSAEVKEIQITFDSNFDVEKKITLSSRRQRQQVPGIPPELICDYELILLYKGEKVAAKKICGNYQRTNRISFEPIICDAVQLNVLSTNGDAAARVFEIRIYE